MKKLLSIAALCFAGAVFTVVATPAPVLAGGGACDSKCECDMSASGDFGEGCTCEEGNTIGGCKSGAAACTGTTICMDEYIADATASSFAAYLPCEALPTLVAVSYRDSEAEPILSPGVYEVAVASVTDTHVTVE